ncbi:alkaline phosphatase [Oceanobacillus sp. J11TS1]|uniref:alkaline phosphatase n=1 Tax=Oceanobacillus sp. J11TS1 TaxID=2807191 RepID=UPI001BB3CBDE|nr:alkaline phosphatase [Oceanobacillus sp. J11TS1]
MSLTAYGSTDALASKMENASEENRNQNAKGNDAEVKNVIFLIGDGMGVSYTSAYRYFKDTENEKYVPQTVFDKYLVGQQATYSEDPHENVTDSAAAATAMSTGVKTYNHAVAVDNDLSEAKTVLESAKESGKSTGLVSTSEITHATPASFGSHDETRKNMNGIADDYYDELINDEHKIDVLLGGGTALFEREDRNLTEEFQQDGYSYVTDKEALLNDDTEQILGLFAEEGLPKMIDRTEDIPSLAEMTNTALDRLSKNEEGFFLMVEGSQIDWAGHDNDIVAAMSEMQDFEGAFQAAIEFAEKDGNTLVVATADHSTGGFSLAANDDYNWFTEPLHAAKRTPDYMAEEIMNGADVRETLSKYIDLELTDKEIQSVEKATETEDTLEVDNAIEEIFNVRSNTGWTTGGHTGEDVNVYAFGPKSEQFAGQIENTDQAKLIFRILEGKDEKTEIKDADMEADTKPEKEATK